MGAWDATSFGNDRANDWAYDLEGCNDLSLIEGALQRVLKAGDKFIDTTRCEEGVAAAEVVAWLRGRPSPLDAYTEKIAKWTAAHPNLPLENVTRMAVAVLDRICQEPSEWAELLDEEPDWRSAIDDLRSRLTS